MNRFVCGIVLAALVTTAGCSNDNCAPVSGLVTLDGKPLAGATVSFQPNDPTNPYPGPGSMAVTGDDGRFTLQLIGKNADKAILGTHKVMITKPVELAAPPKGDVIIPESLAARYNVKTELTFTVTAEGTQAADFALTSKK